MDSFTEMKTVSRFIRGIDEDYEITTKKRFTKDPQDENTKEIIGETFAKAFVNHPMDEERFDDSYFGFFHMACEKLYGTSVLTNVIHYFFFEKLDEELGSREIDESVLFGGKNVSKLLFLLTFKTPEFINSSLLVVDAGGVLLRCDIRLPSPGTGGGIEMSAKGSEVPSLYHIYRLRMLISQFDSGKISDVKYMDPMMESMCDMLSKQYSTPIWLFIQSTKKFPRRVDLETPDVLGIPPYAKNEEEIEEGILILFQTFLKMGWKTKYLKMFRFLQIALYDHLHQYETLAILDWPVPGNLANESPVLKNPLSDIFLVPVYPILETLPVDDVEMMIVDTDVRPAYGKTWSRFDKEFGTSIHLQGLLDVVCQSLLEELDSLMVRYEKTLLVKRFLLQVVYRSGESEDYEIQQSSGFSFEEQKLVTPGLKITELIEDNLYFKERLSTRSSELINNTIAFLDSSPSPLKASKKLYWLMTGKKSEQRETESVMIGDYKLQCSEEVRDYFETDFKNTSVYGLLTREGGTTKKRKTAKGMLVPDEDFMPSDITFGYF